MAATNAQTLFDEGKCYLCNTTANTAQVLRLALLRRILIANVPTADTSSGALMAYGACFACYGMTEVDIIELALLDQIGVSLL